MDKNMVKEEGKNIETFIKYFIEEATMGITILTKEDINLLIDKIYFELNKCIGRKGLVDYWIDTKSIDNPKLKKYAGSDVFVSDDNPKLFKMQSNVIHIGLQYGEFEDSIICEFDITIGISESEY